MSLCSLSSAVSDLLPRLSQTSNGNDPWSAWNSDPSGGSNNNWASNPEGTQTGTGGGDPWSSVSQGHPQAYQGPGMWFVMVNLSLSPLLSCWITQVALKSLSCSLWCHVNLCLAPSLWVLMIKPQFWNLQAEIKKSQSTVIHEHTALV